MSFDPESFGDSRGSNSDTSSRSGSSRFRTVPLVLTILFALAAIVCAAISFSIGGDSSALTSDQETLKSTLLLVGMASFVGLIVSGTKIARK